MDTILDEHLQPGSVGIEIDGLVENPSLQDFISVDAAEAIAVPVDCGACTSIVPRVSDVYAIEDRQVHVEGSLTLSRTTIAAEAVGNGLAAVRCELDLLGFALRDDKAVTGNNDVEAVYGAGVVPAVVAVAEGLELRLVYATFHGYCKEGMTHSSLR